MSAGASQDGPDKDKDQRAECFILIGLENLPKALARGQPVLRQVALPALTPALLYLLKPDRVVCPLFGNQFDAVQVIERLVAIGFGGRLSVIADVPAPGLVQAELAALAPGITVEVLRP